MSSSEKEALLDVKPTHQAERPKIPIRRCQVCGASIRYCNYLRHTRTKKHKDAEYIQFDKFEIK